MEKRRWYRKIRVKLCDAFDCQCPCPPDYWLIKAVKKFAYYKDNIKFPLKAPPC
jgi:hypothetical protein